MRASAFLAFNYVRLTNRGPASLTVHRARHDRPLEASKRGWTNANRGRCVIIQPELAVFVGARDGGRELTGMPRSPSGFLTATACSILWNDVFACKSILLWLARADPEQKDLYVVS